MHCSNCGIEVDAGARFCQECGTSIDLPSEGARVSRGAQGRKAIFRVVIWAVVVVAIVFVGVIWLADTGRLGGQWSQERAERFLKRWVSLCEDGKYEEADAMVHRVTRNFYGAWGVDLPREVGKQVKGKRVTFVYRGRENDEDIGTGHTFRLQLDGKDEGIDLGVFFEDGKPRVIFSG